MTTNHLLVVLEQILPLMPGSAYLLNKNGIFIACTRSQAILFGLKVPGDVSNKTSENIPIFRNHPELLISFDAINQQMIKSAIPVDCEEPIKDTDGQLIVIKYHKIPLLDNKNNVIGLLSVSVDELINNRFCKPMVSNNTTLKQILTYLPGHVYWKDKEGRYLGCNLSQANDLNLTTCDDIIGKTDYDLSSKDKADLFKVIDTEVLTEGKTIDTEEEIIKNGQSRIVLSKKTPLYDESRQIIGLLGISFDITDRKKMEEDLNKAKNAAEAANDAKTEFLTNMRHDIRTPLSGIVGFSELLKSESNDLRIKEYADNLIASSHALLDLMDEVLEAVRVSSGEIPLLKRKFNLSQTLEQIVALYQAKAHEKKLKLSLGFDEKLPSFVIGDKIRLHRIALELVGNALNFTDNGFVSIQVDQVKNENRQLVIKMTVTDTGMGIPKEKQQDIYLQFKRLTPSYQGIYKGAGLGLFVVKQFIDELGGEIYVKSESKKGSCFTCLIPLQEPLLDDDSGVESNDELLSIEKKYLTPLTQQSSIKEMSNIDPDAISYLLVVEDNGIAQMAAKSILSAMHCQVDVATNGAEAIDFCKKNSYDLIFMDIGLGDGIDGYEVTHHIRNMSEKVSKTPIIALTAHGGDENKQRCIEAGMDAVLTKPLTQAHAADIIQNFIPSRKPVSKPNVASNRLDLPDDDDELFRLSQFSLLDSEQALKNCGTQDMLVELLSMMVQEELPVDLACMKEAYAAKDYARVEKTAHKIKGGAVYVGTIRMKYACQYLERYWKAGERELFDALYQQAITTVDETCVYVAQWLSKQ